jgi:hypothetical protein
MPDAQSVNIGKAPVVGDNNCDLFDAFMNKLKLKVHHIEPFSIVDIRTPVFRKSISLNSSHFPK